MQMSESTFHTPKNPEVLTQTTDLGKATALGFSWVSAVLSSVFPPVLSCSLASEYKQETFPSADTTQKVGIFSKRNTFTSRRAIVGPFLPFDKH